MKSGDRRCESGKQQSVLVSVTQQSKSCEAGGEKGEGCLKLEVHGKKKRKLKRRG